MPTPNITKGQIALDPSNGILYYKNTSNTLVNTSLNWSQSTNSLILTDDAVQINSDISISGNLVVSGNTTTLNTEVLTVEDNILILNSGVTGAPSLNAGIEVQRGTSNNVVIRWNENLDKWQLTNDGTNYVNINENVSNANSWSTARTITLSGDATGSISIDGTTNVTLETTVVNDSHDHTASTLTFELNDATDVTISNPTSNNFLKYNGNAWINNPITIGADTVGNYVESLVAGTGITLTNATAAEGGTPTIAVTANTFDSYGAAAAAQSAAVAHADTVSGTAYSNAVTYVNNRVLNDISDVAISNTLANGDFLRYNGDVWINDPVNLATDTVGNYVQSLVAGTGITLTNAAAIEGGTPTIAVTENTFDAYGAAMNSLAAAINYANTVGSTAYSNAVTYVNNRVLDDLSDVTLSNTANGDFLRYSSASNAWINDAINLSTDTIGDYVANIIAGDAIEISNTGGEGSVPTISVALNSIDANHLSLTFEYVENVTAGNNIVVNDQYVGTGSTKDYLISTSATPSFTSVSTTSLSVDGVEIDTSGANSNDQVLRFDTAANKFIPGLASTVAALADLTDVSNTAPSTGDFLYWNGTTWTPSVPATGMPIVSDSAPGSPISGQLWFQSSTARTFIYYIDSSSPPSSQWVEVGTASSHPDLIVSKVTQVIGDGSSNTATVTHNLNTRHVMAEVYDNATFETVEARVVRNSLDSIEINFSGNIPVNAYTVVVIG